MNEYETVLLSKAVIQRLLALKVIVQHTNQPMLNDIILAMTNDYNILAESDVALVYNGYGYEMINRKEVEEQ